MHAVQALYFGLHCSAIEVTTLLFKQLFCFYSEDCNGSGSIAMEVKHTMD